MNNGIDRQAAQAAPPAPEPPRPQWDTSRVRVSFCNIANATATPDGVVLHFGAAPQHGLRQGERIVQLLHRIALRPLTAKNLHQLLSRVLAEHDSGTAAPTRRV